MMILDAQLSSEQVERGSVEADFWHGECMDDAKKNAQKSEFYQGHLHVEFGPIKKNNYCFAIITASNNSIIQRV